MRPFLLAPALVFAFAGGAAAHSASTAYLSIAEMPQSVEIDVALRDLDAVVGLDANGDGAITWGELKSAHAEVAAHVAAHVRFSANDSPCALDSGSLLVDDRPDGTYAALRFALSCAGGAAPAILDYDLLFDLDPTHRGIVRWEGPGETLTATLSPDSRRLVRAEGGSGFGGFFVSGLHHVAFGLDHVLFLIVVILPIAVAAPATRRTAAGNLLRIVTAFTLAHGLSLTLALFGVVTLPARLVESAIAATIVLTAADNVRPFIPGPRWAVAFGFGLIHGLGFAGALGPLDLDGPSLAIALLGFNLGIEAGQVAIAALLLAALWPAISATGRFRAALPVGSAAAMLVGLFWFAERAAAS